MRYRRIGSSLTADCCDVSGAKNNIGNGAIADGQSGTAFWRQMPGLQVILKGAVSPQPEL